MQAVNDPPKFQLLDTQLDVLEYQYTVSSTERRLEEVASRHLISAGPPVSAGVANEDAQNISFTVSSSSEAMLSKLFQEPPRMYPNGTLELHLKPYVSGQIELSIMLVDDGGDDGDSSSSSLPQSLMVHVVNVNNEPRFSMALDPVVTPEVGLKPTSVRFPAAVVNISKGPLLPLNITNEDYQLLSFMVTPLNPAAVLGTLFQSLTMHPNGTLDLTLVPYANGLARYQLVLQDNGGTRLGGRNTSDIHNLSIDVQAVNNAPFFQSPDRLILNETVLTSPLQIFDFAQVVSKGPPIPGGPLPEQWQIDNERDQNISFIVSHSNGELLHQDPVLGADGILKLWLAPYMYGDVNLSVTLVDDGGVDNMGTNASDTHVVMIQVQPVNNAPFFTLAPSSNLIEVPESGTGQNYSKILAVNISKGPPLQPRNITNEGMQTLSFNIVSLTPEVPGNNGPVILAAEVQSDGTITFQVSPYRNGDSEFSIVLHDDGGTYLGGNDTSVQSTFVIRVRAVNDAPSFEAPLSIEVFEATPGVTTLRDLATNISRGPPLASGVENEDLQNLTFIVTAALPQKPQMEQDLFVAGGFPPQIDSNGLLSLKLKPYMNGSIVLNISLQDSGGVAETGEDTSGWRLVKLTVLPVNQPPSFTLPLTVNVSEAPSSLTKQTYLSQTCRKNAAVDLQEIDVATNLRLPGVASQILAGPPSPEEDRQSYTFHVTQELAQREIDAILDSRQRYFNGPHSLSLLPHMHGNGSDSSIKLFRTIHLAANGTLTLQLTPEAFGIAAFRVSLEDDGDSLGSIYNDSSNRSFPDQHLLLVVHPVNNPPFFWLRTCYIQLSESTQFENKVTVHDVIFSISHGAWAEDQDQTLVFEVEQIAGPIGVVYGLDVLCKGPFNHSMPANTETARKKRIEAITSRTNVNTHVPKRICHGGVGDLEFFLEPDRWGNITLNVTLRDSGGGMNSFSDILTLEIRPVNSVPTFQLAETTVNAPERFSEQYGCCEPFVMPNFATAISLGPWEDAQSADCLSGTVPCESQQATFSIKSTNTNVSNNLFASLPTLHRNGTLMFTLRIRANSEQYGVASFLVFLQDDSSLDGVPQSSGGYPFDIFVRPINSPPAFNILAPSIEVLEDSGQHDQLIAANISADGSSDRYGSEAGQSLTFIVHVSSGSHIFARTPTISEAGVLKFETAQDEFGETVLVVGLQDSGGALGGGNDTFEYPRNISVSVLPVNDAPTLTVKPEISLVVTAGMSLTYRLVTKFSVGPLNERCSAVSASCQTQTLSFQVTDVSNPTLFQSIPYIRDDGSLFTYLAEESAGTTDIFFKAIDDGALYSDSGFNTTSASVRITFETENIPPSFSLPWRTRCGPMSTLVQMGGETISCQCDLASPSKDCLLLDPSLRLGPQGAHAPSGPVASDLPSPGGSAQAGQAVVYGRQGAGRVEVQNFATDVTSASGIRRASVSAFEQDASGSSLLKLAHVNEYRGGSEYFVAGAVTHDQRHIYHAESTDSLAIYERSNASQAKFLDRRSQREDRVRFVGLEDGAVPGSEGRLVHIPQFASASLVTIQNRVFVTAASAAIDIPDALDIVREESRPESVSHDMYASAIGHWDFSLTRVDADSVFSRPINTRFCNESFPTRVQPASFKDFGGLGAAQLRGPACKSDTDWDQGSTSFSVLNFLANNGDEDALQVPREGLVVLDDLAEFLRGEGNSTVVLASPTLPSAAITVSVWMSVSGDARHGFAALIAAAQAGQCTGGFVFGYTMQASSSVLQFDVALKQASEHESPRFAIAAVTVPRFQDGMWYHLAASYDGHVQRLYLDGQLVLSSMVCADGQRRGAHAQSCGEIIYPISALSPACHDPTALTLGSYTNVETGEVSAHIGLLKQVSIWNYSLPTPRIQLMYSLLAARLKGSRVLQAEYWVQLFPAPNASGRPRMTSPSSNFALKDEIAANAHDAPNISLFGRFSATGLYTCRFANENLTMDSHAPPHVNDSTHSSSTAILSCTSCKCEEGTLDTLTCPLPKWAAPARHSAAQVSVIKFEASPTGYRQVKLWQRVCYHVACGFKDIPMRTVTSQSVSCVNWLLASSSTAHKFAAADQGGSTTPFLNPLLVGTAVVFRFATLGSIFKANTTGLHFLQNIARNDAITSFDDMVTQGSASTTFFRSHDEAGESRHCNLFSWQRIAVVCVN